jgi:carbonic anhydrase
MLKLINGIHKFQSDVFQTHEELFQRLVGGQHPQALFITCSDSRMVPDLICQTDPGDLFVLRNAGNLVPSYVPGTASAEAATIEYAIRGLGIKDIIVCGHTKCGAMKAAMHPEDVKDMPRVRQWLANADASAEIVETQYANLPPDARWQVMVQENVLVQLENLRTHPAVAVGLASGEVKLHAWVYKIETGQVFAYDPTTGQYGRLVRDDGEGPGVPLARRTVSTPPPLHAVPATAI